MWIVLLDVNGEVFYRKVGTKSEAEVVAKECIDRALKYYPNKEWIAEILEIKDDLGNGGCA